MALFAESFETWSAGDFDAYAEPKWKSNRFNLERGRVRMRLLSLLEQASAQAGVERDGLELWTSLDHPAFVNLHAVPRQQVLWTRDAERRAALQARDPAVEAAAPDATHLHVGLVIDHDRVRLVWRVPLAARFDQPAWRAGVEAVVALAEAPGAQLRLDDTAADVAGLRAAAAAGADHDVRVEWSWEREAALQGQPTIAQVAEWLAAALPVLRAVEGAVVVPEAPAPAPEPAASAEPVRPATILPPPRHHRPPRPVAPPGSAHVERPPPDDRRIRAPYRPPGDQAMLAPQTERQAPPRPPAEHFADRRPHPQAGDRRPRPGEPLGRGPAPQEARERPRGDERGARPQFDRNRPPEGRGGPPEPRPDRRGPPPGPPFRGAPGRPYELGPTREERTAAHEAVEPGAKVTLLSGLFKGKVATVTQVAGDQVQVHLGLMAVKVPLGEVRLAR